MSNIYNTFRVEMGYTTASIQYTELALRIAENQYGKRLNNTEVVTIAREHGLSISEIPGDFNKRLINSYIVQVHSCLEHFLYDYKQLTGSSTNEKEYHRDDDNYLHWTMEHALGKNEKTYDSLYQVCDYYRLVRNTIIHNGKIDEQLKVALAKAQKSVTSDDEKLDAPNELDKLCFDDQVLFARSAQKLAKAIFRYTDYNWEEIIDRNKTKIDALTCSCKHDNDRCIDKVTRFLSSTYPVDGLERIQISKML